MKKTKIVPRINKQNGDMELFYYDHRKDIVCVHPSEGHCSSEYSYYRDMTLRVPVERMEEARKMIANYIGKDILLYTQSRKLI
jgi:Fe-S cluster biogenesis protein NfuA